MSCGYFQLYPHWVLIMSCSFPNQNVGAWFGYGTKCEFFFSVLGIGVGTIFDSRISYLTLNLVVSHANYMLK
jgi:hypothetical protein